MSARALDFLASDLRVAFRAFRRAPAVTVFVVLILALAIGSATTMLTVVRATLVHRLPVRDPERLLALWPYRDPAIPLALTAAQLSDLQQATRTLVDVAGVMHWGAQAIPLTEGSRSVLLKQGMVTANFFEALGATPALGRLLASADERAAAGRVAVISFRTWQRVFQADPQVLGRRLTTTQDGAEYRVVGVAPPGLDYPVGVDYWIVARPFDLLTVVARLAPSATAEQARAEFTLLTQSLDRESAAPSHPIGATVQTFAVAILGNVQPVLITLTAAVLLLLVIAALNVGALLLVRLTHRDRELVIRRALGGSSAQLVRLLFTEHAILGVAGGVGGLACAIWALRVIAYETSIHVPRVDMVQLAGAPLGIAVLVTSVMTALFAALPARAVTRGDLASDLRHDARTGHETHGRRRMRRSLVMIQVALAVVLMSGAGLLVRSLQQLQNVRMGFRAEGLSVLVLSVPFHKYEQSVSTLWTLFGTLEERLRNTPGVMAVTPVLYEPFVGANLMQVTPRIEGQALARGEVNVPVPLEVGGHEYFQALDIPIVRGRAFSDDGQDAPRVVVVSEAAARRWWPGEDAVGKRLQLGGIDSTEWRTVVGVAADVRYRRVHEATPTIFLPWRQLTQFGVFAIRTTGALAGIMPALERAVKEMDPDLHVWTARGMSSYLDDEWAQPRVSSMMLSGFGLTALVLATLGLYGLMSSLVRQRQRDMSIRLALGATPGQLQFDVLREALVVVGAGAVAGIALSLAGGHLLNSLLYGVEPSDPLALVAVATLLIVVAAAATGIPLQWVRRLDAAATLRSE